MKVQPYFVSYSETWVLGPAASVDTREFRIGLGLIFCEVGLCFISEKPFGYVCSGCDAIGEGTPDQLPPWWEKKYRRDRTYYFLCPNCLKEEREIDYLITDDYRKQVIDEIIGELFGEETDKVEAKAVRDYANKLLDESEHSKYDLDSAMASYLDGFTEAGKYLGTVT